MPRTWTSPQDLAGTPARRGDEFPPAVAEAMSELRARGGLAPTPEDADAQRERLHFAQAGVNRRGFLRLTGAAAVVALVSGCGKKPHPDTLVAYDQQPEGATLGAGLHFSTSVRVGGSPRPVVARSYDGRPIKLDGNPDHPLVDGRSDAATQAAVLDLYDPDRGGLDPERPGAYHDGPKGAGGGSCTWADLDAAVAAGLRQGRIGLITGPLSGPAELALVARLQEAFAGRLAHAAYHPYAPDSAVEARRRVLGAASAPVFRLERARLLVSFGSDILADEGTVAQVAFGRFRRGPGPDAGPGQVIAVEATLGQTGTVADVRVRTTPDRLAWVAWAVAAEIGCRLGLPLPPAVAAALPGQDLGLRPVPTREGGVPAVAFIAERLLAVRAAGAASLVHVGGATHSGPESLDLHLAATWLNQALGNEGRSVTAGPVTASIAAAGALLGSGLRTLIVAGADPAFSLPGAAAAIAGIPLVVSLNATRDATTRLAHWHAPGLHDLESWGDASLRPGCAELRQPLILPLWNSRAAEESLLAFAVGALGEAAPAAFRVPRTQVPPAGSPVSVVTRTALWSASEHGVRPWRDLVREVWTTQVRQAAGAAASGDAFWSAALARGFVELPEAPAPAPAATAADLPAPPAPRPGLQLVCTASRTIGDGSALNNAWLQELPDPVSKICWDGYAALSPVDARAAGIAEHDVVRLQVGAATATLPVHVQEGQHPGVVEVFLGWGREDAGQVAGLTAEDGHRCNAFLLAGRRWGAEVSLARTGAAYVLASAQAHHRMEGRPIALDQVLGLPPGGPASHAHWVAGTDGRPGGRLSIWRRHHTHPGRRWGMAIDLDACTGCGACMVACSAENNVPVVGRDEVRNTRDMHWMRVDRYYLGEDDLDVAVTHQPMLCQQCDHAPCEAVCPANATVKSDQGVNLQVYNRCIGTRYCSNNCPYKVRRFNWYQYSSFRAGPQGSADPLARLAKNAITDGAPAATRELAHHPLNLLLNPEVTVRHRGVMEKCNFCVQRQRQAATGGQPVSACAQACPTAAIAFGDLNDPDSAPARAGGDPRAHLVLDHEFNTRPKVAYLRKIRNRPATAADEERHG